MGRKHEEQEKRHWMTSVTAYVASLIAGVGAIAFANPRSAPPAAMRRQRDPRCDSPKDAEKIKSTDHAP